jgi:hypothetical protein
MVETLASLDPITLQYMVNTTYYLNFEYSLALAMILRQKPWKVPYPKAEIIHKDALMVCMLNNFQVLPSPTLDIETKERKMICDR